MTTAVSQSEWDIHATPSRTADGAAVGLVDRFGRLHTNLRVSVTDRCNIRCFYCMPNERIRFRPKREMLTFEEVTRAVSVAASLGVNRLRLTGGEPLLRRGVDELIGKLVNVPGIDEVTMTTNGILLNEQAESLKRVGLTRLNISLDTLREEMFERIARRKGLHRVLEGIEAAQDAGFDNIRLNAVPIRGLSEDDIVPLADFAVGRGLTLRFIEFMPLDADEQWDGDQFIRGSEVLSKLEQTVGPLNPSSGRKPCQPAVDFRTPNGGIIGFINPVSQPFCDDCNRLRMTAEGQLRNCLFSREEWDARSLLRRGGSDEELANLFASCVAAKRAGHGIDSPEFLRPARAMYQIGG